MAQIIGLDGRPARKSTAPAATPADRADEAVITTGTAQNFAAEVIEASMSLPVIVDFWAPWCGPCKQLGPLIAAAVKRTKGRVKLVKIDIDQNQALARQMRIQSIPMVYAFFQGRAIDGFQGALPESQIRQFVERLAAMGGADADAVGAAIEQAKAALDAGDAGTASALYAQLHQRDPDNIEVLVGLGRALIALNRIDEVRKIIAGLNESMASKPEIASLCRALSVLENAQNAGDISLLRRTLDADPHDHQTRIDLALALLAAGDRAAAVEHLLESISRDRSWGEEAARKQLLRLFDVFGPTDPLTIAARKRLSAVLLR